MNAHKQTKHDAAEAVRLASLAIAGGDYLEAVCQLSTAQRLAAILHGTAQYVEGIDYGRLFTPRTEAA